MDKLSKDELDRYDFTINGIPVIASLIGVVAVIILAIGGILTIMQAGFALLLIGIGVGYFVWRSYEMWEEAENTDTEKRNGQPKYYGTGGH